MAVDRIDPYGFKEWENNFFDWDVEIIERRAKDVINSKDPYGF